MIKGVTNNFSYPKTMLYSFAQRNKQVSFCADISKVDTIELSGENKTKNGSDNNLEILKQQQISELNKFVKTLKNLSRTELATEKYELTKWGCEIQNLRTTAEKIGLTEVQKLRLNGLIAKLNLIYEREKEIEKPLKPFYPADTVSEKSFIPEHHKVFGYNSFIRDAIKSRNDNFKGLSEEEIKLVLRMEDDMKRLDNQFEQLPPLEHDCIVYKGSAEQPDSLVKDYNKPFELMEKAKVGDIVTPDTAYSYTAFDRSTAECFGGEGGRHIGKNGEEYRIMMYEILIPKGAKVSRNLEHRGEILMPRNAKYKLTDKKILKNGDMEITLEYILPNK